MIIYIIININILLMFLYIDLLMDILFMDVNLLYCYQTIYIIDINYTHVFYICFIHAQ